MIAAGLDLPVLSDGLPPESVDLLAELGIAYFTSGRRVAAALAALVPGRAIRQTLGS